MPIAIKHKVNNSATWLLWEIEETEEWFLQNVAIDAQELADFETIISSKRRLEWLGGRMAAQTLCKDLGINYQGIGKLETGKPILKGQTLELSLSHCYPLAVAYIHQSQVVGIDLDSPKEKMLKVAPRILNESEFASLGTDIERACQFWCAKEVLYKVYSHRGLVFKEDLEVNFGEVGIVGIVKKNGLLMEYPLEFYKFKNHFLCYNI